MIIKMVLKNLKAKEEDWKDIMQLRLDLNKRYVHQVIKMLLQNYFDQKKKKNPSAKRVEELEN